MKKQTNKQMKTFISLNKRPNSFFSLFFLITGLLIFTSSSYASALFEPELEVFYRAKVGEPIRVMALFEYLDDVPAPLVYQRSEVIRYLQYQTDTVYKKWISAITSQKTNPRDLRVSSVSWVNHSVTAWVNPDGLRQMVRSPFLKKIYWVRPERQESSVGRRRSFAGPVSPSYAVQEIGLDEVRKRYPDIKGNGQLIGMIDTGVAAQSQFLNQKVVRFFDASQQKIRQPFDFGDHGTGVASLLVGGSPQNPLGVAPLSQLVVSAGFDTEHLIRGMEFMLNPDGDSSTTADIPKVVNNSWNSDGQDDQEVYYRALASLESLGVVMVFSAGNMGPQPRTISHPKEFPSTLVVGATEPGLKIWNNSSVGPAVFKGKDMLKPDIVAPGVDILVSFTDGKLISQTGTSFSSPWVTGTLALMLQVNPSMSPEDLRTAILKTANAGRGDPWNPQWGWGVLNVRAALEKIIPPGRIVGNTLVGPGNFQQGRANINVRQILSWAETREGVWRSQ